MPEPLNDAGKEMQLDDLTTLRPIAITLLIMKAAMPTELDPLYRPVANYWLSISIVPANSQTSLKHAQGSRYIWKWFKGISRPKTIRRKPIFRHLEKLSAGCAQQQELHGAVESVVKAVVVVHVRVDAVAHPRHRHIHCGAWKTSRSRAVHSFVEGAEGYWDGRSVTCSEIASSV